MADVIQKSLRSWIKDPENCNLYVRQLVEYITTDEKGEDIKENAINLEEGSLCSLARAMGRIAMLLRHLKRVMKVSREYQILLQDCRDAVHQLQRNLLDRLFAYMSPKRMAQLDQVLRSQPHYSSPWKVASDCRDDLFFESKVVQEFTLNRWRGFAWTVLMKAEGEENHDQAETGFLKKCGHIVTKGTSMSAYDLFVYLGFAMPIADTLLQAASWMTHNLLIGSCELLQLSPFGRWLVHCSMEILFLGGFQFVLYYPSNTFTYTWLVALLIYYIGNIWTLWLLLWYEFNMNARKFALSRFPYNIYLCVFNLVMVGLVAVKINKFSTQGEDYAPVYYGDSEDAVAWDQIALGSMAPFVWVQVMGTCFLPASETVAAQFMIIFDMLVDLIFFMLPLVVIMGSFATFFSIAVPVAEGFGDFPSALLTLFEACLGNFNFGAILGTSATDVGISPGLQIFVTCALVIYLAIAMVTLLNFLIAIMASHYDLSRFNAYDKVYSIAQVQEIYVVQVEHAFWCAPLNLVFNNPITLLMEVLLHDKSGRRIRTSPHSWHNLGLPHPDGPASQHTSPLQQLPGGLKEAAYFTFLVTLFPAISLFVTLLQLSYIPFAAVYFATVGYYTTPIFKYKVANEALEEQQSARRGLHVLVRSLHRLLLSPLLFCLGLILYTSLCLAYVTWLGYIWLAKVYWTLKVMVMWFFLGKDDDAQGKDTRPLELYVGGDETKPVLGVKNEDLPQYLADAIGITPPTGSEQEWKPLLMNMMAEQDAMIQRLLQKLASKDDVIQLRAEESTRGP